MLGISKEHFLHFVLANKTTKIRSPSRSKLHYSSKYKTTR